MTIKEIRKLVLERMQGKIKRAELLEIMSDKELTEWEIRVYPEYLSKKRV